MNRRTAARPAWACLVPAALSIAEAAAAPPFALDDGDVEEVGHVETDLGTLAAADGTGPNGDLLYLEGDLGVAPGIEADLVLPVAFTRPHGRRLQAGLGDLELQAKVRVVDQSASPVLPSIALDPMLSVPTRSAALGSGSGHAQTFLPVWLSRNFGPWTVFGGGEYTINPGAGQRDYLVAGVGLVRTLFGAWHVGGESYETSRTARDGPSMLSIDVDLICDVLHTVHPFVSIGRGVGVRPDRISVFAGVQIIG